MAATKAAIQPSGREGKSVKEQIRSPRFWPHRPRVYKGRLYWWSICPQCGHVTGFNYWRAAYIDALHHARSQW